MTGTGRSLLCDTGSGRIVCATPNLRGAASQVREHQRGGLIDAYEGGDRPVLILHAPDLSTATDPLPPRWALLLARPVSRARARSFVRLLEHLAGTNPDPAVRAAADTILRDLVRRGETTQ